MKRYRIFLRDFGFGMAAIIAVVGVLATYSVLSHVAAQQEMAQTTTTIDMDAPTGSSDRGAASGSSLPNRPESTQQSAALTKFQESASLKSQFIPVPDDPFASAVRLAEQAGINGQKALSAREWLVLAVQWQIASDWMAQVPASDPRYLTAQDRVYLYLDNSQIAMGRAVSLQGIR